MRVFVAGIFTETNTFAPSPTGLSAFAEMGIRRGDGSGISPAFEPATRLLNELASAEGHEIVPGLLAIAQPGGTVVRSVYESLRDELLDGLRRRGRVDAVILLLHGAMVADGQPDCEGDLIDQVRRIVGPETSIGVELDLHCHLSERMRQGSEVLIAYKEYPHVDVLDRLRELWRLMLATALGQIQPTTAAVDCHMNGLWPTTHGAMASFVQRMRDTELQPGVLSVSLGHGFPWGDVPEAGAKLWVITDNDPDLASRLARELAAGFWALRDVTRLRPLSLSRALEQLAGASDPRPIVIADIADNPGGGAGGDSTFILRGLIENSVSNVALGAFWDPTAVLACHDAGIGAVFDLRIGGKSGKAAGAPLDLRATVRAVSPQHHQRSLGGAPQPCGASAWITVGESLDLVLVSKRQQVLGTDLFTGLGVDLSAKRAIVVKSQQHFHAAFEPLASEVLYVDTPGLLRSDIENLAYRHRDPDQWPSRLVPERWSAPCDRMSSSCHRTGRPSRLR